MGTDFESAKGAGYELDIEHLFDTHAFENRAFQRMRGNQEAEDGSLPPRFGADGARLRAGFSEASEGQNHRLMHTNIQNHRLMHTNMKPAMIVTTMAMVKIPMVCGSTYCHPSTRATGQRD